MQLNIWMGYLLDAAIEFIQSEQPDILCVQEVMSTANGHPLFAIYQTHEVLAEIFPYQFLAPTYTIPILGEATSYGNAIYSKFPISEQQVRFTCGEFRELQTIQNFTANIRNVQSCTLTLPAGKTFTIANHHGYREPYREGTSEADASMQKVTEHLQTVTRPLVLCGDLNKTATSSTVYQLDPLGLCNLTAESGAATTLTQFSKIKEDLACDFIFVSPDIQVRHFEVSETIISDHKALLMEFEL